jgi:hypothetical protein
MSDLESPLPQSQPEGSTPVPPVSPGAPELEMRRRAAAVLEVLGGARTPSDAAEALGISLPRYYLLEARALEGLVTSCEPRSRGRSSGEGRTLRALRQENDQLRQDLSRTQALARAVQRAAGMPADGNDSPLTDGRVRRHRKPHARALRAARHLSPDPVPSPPVFPETPTASSSTVVEPPP